jgi:hypothetical protein
MTASPSALASATSTQHRQRRAQLVADVGQELDAQPIEVLESLIRLLELPRALADPLLEQQLGIE